MIPAFASLWVVYEFHCKKWFANKPMYIGKCLLSEITQTPDAWTYVEFRDAFKNCKEIVYLEIIDLYDDETTATIGHSVHVQMAQPYINSTTARCSVSIPRGKRGAIIKEITYPDDVGEWSSANELAAYLKVTPQAVGKHLNGKQSSIQGRKFKRVET